MSNKSELSKKIDRYAEEFGVAGAVAVFKDGECYHKNFYGLADQEKGIPITENSTYLMSFNSRFLMGLCIGMLIDEGNLRLEDKLDKYIPEYSPGSDITINQLCLKQSGIPDFFNGGIMKEQQADVEYQTLIEVDRNIADRKLLVHPWKFENAITYANGKELTCEPGTEPTDDLDNMAETLFMREVIERASGKSLPNYVRSEIYAPFGIVGKYLKVNTKPYGILGMINYINTQYEEDSEYTFSLTYEEAEKLLFAALEKKLLSEKAWEAISKPATFGQSIGFNLISGWLSARDFGYGSLGWSCYIYFDRDVELGLIHLTNSELIVRNINGSWHQFRKAFREEVAAAFVFPKNTSLIPYGKDNYWDVMQLSIHDKQLEYMFNAKEAICLAYAYEHKLFILTEGSHSVGLVAFSKDSISGEYYIESVLIDKRYQQRGFGKIMMIKGIEYLKSVDCKHLSIGVNRYNIAAQNLYKSVGFKEKTVYEDFIELETHFD